MKQMLFLIGLMAIGMPWTLVSPFVGVVLFYGLDLIHPETLWWYAEGDFGQIRWSFCIAIVVLVSIFLHMDQVRKVVRNWPLEKMLMLLFAVCVVLSTWMAEKDDASRVVAEAYGKIFLMYFLATALIDSRHRLNVMFWATAICLAYVAQDFNQMYILQHHYNIGRRGFGGLDNNGLALFMVMAMPFGCWVFLQAKQWIWKAAALLGMILALHVVLFTYSRGGMLAMGVMGGFLLWRMPRSLWKPVIAGALITAVLVLSGPEVRSRFFSIEQHEIDESALARKTNWKAAIRIMSDNEYTMFGAGPRGYGRINADYGGTGPGRAVHNQYLQIGADLGVPAMLIFLCMLGATLLSAARIQRQHRDKPWLANSALAIQASIIGYVVAATFLSLDRFEFIYLIFALGTALKALAMREAKLAEEASTVAKAKPIPSTVKATAGVMTGLRTS
jgi:probable O-glycosylation ligase (exosortase A-associated)